MSTFESLYTSFNMYTKPKQVNSCECCCDDEEIKVLLSKKLKDISADEISHYASSVFLTVGSKKDFLYFFPRIFELCLSDQFNWPDPEVVFNAISNADFETWSDNQKKLVITLAKNKFISLLKTDEDGSEMEQWLCAIARTEPEISYYLDLLECVGNIDALHKFVDWNSDCISSKKLANRFWVDCPEQEEEVIAWLRQGKPSEYLFEMYGMRM
jgi:hypothetical protein